MGDSTRNREVLILTCDTCGNKFHRKNHRVRKKFTFCSRKCVNYIAGAQRKRPFEWLYNKLLKGADTRGLDVALSYDDFISFTIVRNCHYCGSEVKWPTHHRPVKGAPTGYNLDRKDASKGYTLENVVVCCERCNKSKRHWFSYEEWLQIGLVIRGWPC